MLGLLVMAGSLHAEILYDNLGETEKGPYRAENIRWLAQEFRTGTAGEVYVLEGAVLKAARYATQLPLLRLFSDNGNKPGVPLSTLTMTTPILDIAEAPSTSDVAFTDSGYSMAPDTSYWMVLTVAEGGSGVFGWGYTSSSHGTGVGFSQANAISRDRGTSWTVYADWPYQMQVTAQAVPEPASLTLLCMGGGLALWLNRRRAK